MPIKEDFVLRDSSTDNSRDHLFEETTSLAQSVDCHGQHNWREGNRAANWLAGEGDQVGCLFLDKKIYLYYYAVIIIRVNY